MKLHTVIYLKSVLKNRRILMLSLLLYPLLMFIFDPEPFSTLGVILSIMFFINIIANIIYYKSVKGYRVLGTLSIEENGIVVNTNVYKFSEIEYLKVFYNGYKGQLPLFSPIVDVFGSNDGVSNVIILKTNKQIIESKFLLEYPSQKEELLTILKEYESNGVHTEIKIAKTY